MPHWEKILSARGRAVLSAPPQNFFRAGVCRQIFNLPPGFARQAPAPRPSERPVSHRRLLRVLAWLSAAVFALWHEWHRLCRLAGSTNRCQSPSNGMTWSTSVARTRRPRCAHARQNGSRSSWFGRRSSVQTGRLYHRRHARLSALRRSTRFGWCCAQ